MSSHYGPRYLIQQNPGNYAQKEQNTRQAGCTARNGNQPPNFHGMEYL